MQLRSRCEGVRRALTVSQRRARSRLGWETWVVRQTAARRRNTGVPQEVSLETEPEIAPGQITIACAASLPRGVVLMDAGHGNDSELRAGSC